MVLRWGIVGVVIGLVLVPIGVWAATEIVVLSASDGAPEFKMIIPWLEEFEHQTGIKVNFVEMGYGPLHTKLATLFATGSASVDVVWTYAAWTAEFASAGYLLDITDWLTEDLLSDLTGAVTAVTYKDRIYGLPKFGSTRFFYYNKEMFEEVGLDPDKPPTTWTEFLNAAKLLTRDVDEDGVVDQWGFLPSGVAEGENAVMDFQLIYMLAGGTELFDSEDRPLFAGPEGIEALERYVELYDLGVVDPAAWSIVSGSDRRMRWMQGNTGMVFEWPSLWRQANDPDVSRVAGNVGISIIPMIYTSASLDGSEAYAISTFSRNKEAAFEFLKFVVSPEVQKDIALRCGWLPVRKSVLADPALQQSPLGPMFEVASLQNQYPIRRFAAPYAQEVIDAALGPAILKAVQHEMTPEAALQWAAEKASEIVAKYKQ